MTRFETIVSAARTGKPRRRPSERAAATLCVVVALLVLSGMVAGCASAPAASASRGAVQATASTPVELDDGRAERQILVTVEPRDSWGSARAGTSSKAYGGRYRASARTRKLVRAIASDYELREVASWPMRPLGVHCIVFELPEQASADEVIDRLAEDERVESVEPMQIFEVETGSYNDPYVDLQHGVDAMQVREAQRWALGEGVRIAVVDTGVELSHPELSDHIRVARDFVSARGEEMPPDHHGTSVAGVIVASINNGIGIIGVAPSAELVVLRACWEASAETRNGICNSFTLAKALVAAIEQRPDVINLSLAGPADPLLERLLRVAVDRGILVVAATSDRQGHSFPAGVAGVVAVGAHRGGDGEQEIEGAQVGAVLAPGDEILTTVPGGSFDFVSGHSLAAAHVSGVAALLLELRPRLSGAELGGLLRAASRREISPGIERVGLLNACAALARLVGESGCGG